jgi:hypothetical protein
MSISRHINIQTSPHRHKAHDASVCLSLVDIRQAQNALPDVTVIESIYRETHDYVNTLFNATSGFP